MAYQTLWVSNAIAIQGRTVILQCNPDIRELLGPENKYLISGFGLFCLGNTGSNFGPEKISLISEFLLYPGYTVFNSWLGGG